MHVIKMYLHRIAMALFFKMINIWWFDTWTWPSGIAVGACLRLNLPCLLLWIHHYNSWHKCITIYTVNTNSNMGQISHNVPITSELRSLLCNPHYRPPSTCTLRMHIHVESVKQSFSIMIFVPVVEHAPTLTVCLSLTNFKEPISQKDLWNFWFDKSLCYYPSLVSKCKKYSAYMVKFMNDCLMENHGFEIHLMIFCERTTQQLIELDAFTVVIKHDTVETNINMFNNVIWPLTQKTSRK